jgi:hypothetical protein
MKWVLIVIVAGHPIETGYETEKVDDCLMMARASEADFDASTRAIRWEPRTQKPFYTCIAKGGRK